MIEQEFNELLQSIENKTFISNELTIITKNVDRQIIEGQFSFNDEKAVLLAETLKKNPSITKVNLRFNDIRDTGATALAGVETIEELILFENSIGVIGATALAGSNLKILCLEDNNIIYKKESDEEYKQFVRMINAFINNKTIIDLNLHGCYIPSELIAQLIGNNSTIKVLGLVECNLTDEALKFIGNNFTLEKLNYSLNNVTNKGTEYISKNTSLKELYLDIHYFADSGIKFLNTHLTLEKLNGQNLIKEIEVKKTVKENPNNFGDGENYNKLSGDIDHQQDEF